MSGSTAETADCQRINADELAENASTTCDISQQPQQQWCHDFNRRQVDNTVAQWLLIARRLTLTTVNHWICGLCCEQGGGRDGEKNRGLRGRRVDTRVVWANTVIDVWLLRRMPVRESASTGDEIDTKNERMKVSLQHHEIWTRGLTLYWTGAL